jgi:hypothetical protein
MSELSSEAAGLIAVGWAGRKLLGPTFEQIGVDLSSRYSASRLRNFVRITKNAAAKSGESLNRPGQVNPRVLMKVLDEGSVCDGPVMAEYFGGILAGSRSPDGANDRGLTWAGVVSRLSTSDVHLHYLFYEAFRRVYLNRTDLTLGMENIRDQCELYIEAEDLRQTRGLDEGDWETQVAPPITSLIREGLLGRMHLYGHPEHLERAGSTLLGLALF